MRILIIGASGFIGRRLAYRFSEPLLHDVFGTYWSTTPGGGAISWNRVDLTDPEGVKQVFRLARPDAVLHLAAIADVNTAERERERAEAVNATATSAIAHLCQQHSAKLIFVSTEYVFDGKRGYYREDDAPCPTTHYGQTKWEAERAVMELTSPWSVLRTSIVYGWPGPEKRNFVPWLIQSLLNSRAYHGPTDVYRTPIYLGDLADGIARLVEGDFQGIYHVAGRDWVSMYAFAIAVARAFNLDEELVVPVPSFMTAPVASQPRQGAAPRRNGDLLGLDCSATMKSLGIVHPGLAEGIARLKADAPNLEAMR